MALTLAVPILVPVKSTASLSVSFSNVLIFGRPLVAESVKGLTTTKLQ